MRDAEGAVFLPCETGGREGREEGFVFLRQARKGVEVLFGGGKTLLCGREHGGAHEVAGEGGIGIALVGAPGEGAGGEVCLDFCLGKGEHGPRHPFAGEGNARHAATDGGEALGPGAARQGRRQKFGGGRRNSQ